MGALKYAGLHIVSILTAIAFVVGGLWMWTGLILVVSLALFTDELMGEDHQPIVDQDNRIYDVLLWLTPASMALLVVTLASNLDGQHWFNLVGAVLGLGFILGSLGLVVGHELIHRIHSPWERFAGTLLFAASFDSYFAYSHPFGHHRWVSTVKDTSTARRGETVYAFMIRSARDSWLQGMEIGERKARNQLKEGYRWYKNPVVWQHSYSLIWVALWVLFGGWLGLVVCILVGLFGKCLLEAVNYIEHYGLSRKVNERVKPHHSWNSASVMSQYLLFNLSRHSDHHAVGQKHFQTLDSEPDFPTLPHGYLGMVLVALIPPLYFRQMKQPLRQWNMANAGVHA